MKNKVILIIFSIVGCFIILQSCIREKYTNREAYLYNQTSVGIKILPYNNGRVAPEDTIILEAGAVFLFGSDTHWGTPSTPGFSSKYFYGNHNPTVVLFDNQYPVVHLNDFGDTTVIYYPVTSLRNLGNPESYEFSRKKGKKGVYTNIHNYYFTEADYEYAKD